MIVDNFFHYLSTHPVAAFAVAVIILFMVYFVVKKLLKVAFIAGLILIAVCAYFYYKAPEEFPKNVQNAVSEMKSKTGEMADKSKTLIDKGKVLLEKGKDVAEDIGKNVEKNKD